MKTCILILCFFLASCAENVGGTRIIPVSQNEEPEDEQESIAVNCYDDGAGKVLRYIIQAYPTLTTLQSCTGSVPTCGDEFIMLPTTNGSGSNERPCLMLEDSDFLICLGVDGETPENPDLVNMEEFKVRRYDRFFCEERINDILR